MNKKPSPQATYIIYGLWALVAILISTSLALKTIGKNTKIDKEIKGQNIYLAELSSRKELLAKIKPAFIESTKDNGEDTSLAERIYRALPTDPDDASNNLGPVIENIYKESGLGSSPSYACNDASAKKSNIQNSTIAKTCKIKLGDSYDKFKKFLQNIESSARVINMNDITLTFQTERGGSTKPIADRTVNADISLVAYYAKIIDTKSSTVEVK